MGKGAYPFAEEMMPVRPRVLFLFLDGVGIGKRDGRVNPFFAETFKSLESLLGGRIPHLRDARVTSELCTVQPIRATLGVPGLPQSGTGQTSLLTGINAARFIGKHFGPYPYSTLQPVLQEKNIFRQLHTRGRRVMYANAFPQRFFDHIKVRKNRMSAITMSWLMSGFELNDAAALLHGQGLSADVTNERWPDQEKEGKMPVISPQEAGNRFTAMAQVHDFVFFEFFLTDHAGHSRSMEEAVNVLRRLDAFVEGILSTFDHRSMLLVLTSDHGNLEDLSTKTHTCNPVPLLCYGHGHEQIANRVRALPHITPAIVEIM